MVSQVNFSEVVHLKWLAMDHNHDSAMILSMKPRPLMFLRETVVVSNNGGIINADIINGIIFSSLVSNVARFLLQIS